MMWGLGRKTWRLAGFFVMAVAFLLVCLGSGRAQVPDSNDGPLQRTTDVSRAHQIGNDEIVRMSKAGLSDDILIQTIQLQPGHYDVTPDDLIALKTAGVSQKVIIAMQTHGTGLGIRAKPAALGIETTAQSLGIEEFGVYYKAKDGEWIPLKTERVTVKSGGTIKNILSDGYIQRDMNGHVDKAKSELKLPTGVEILIYAPAGTEGSEYDFLRFRGHPAYREFRTLTGGILHSASGADRDEVMFQPKRIAAQLYTFTVPIDIEKGEYGVLPPASAGLQGTGKIYTFSIQE